MVLETLPIPLTVCKLASADGIDWKADFTFIGKTDEELSLVCPTKAVPADTVAREDGWRGFRIQGVLDFSLTGILSRLSGLLAEEGIGLFAISTYNTDYILVKQENLDRALRTLADAGYRVAPADQ